MGDRERLIGALDQLLLNTLIAINQSLLYSDTHLDADYVKRREMLEREVLDEIQCREEAEDKDADRPARGVAREGRSSRPANSEAERGARLAQELRDPEIISRLGRLVEIAGHQAALTQRLREEDRCAGVRIRG